MGGKAAGLEGVTQVEPGGAGLAGGDEVVGAEAGLDFFVEEVFDAGLEGEVFAQLEFGAEADGGVRVERACG